VNITSSGLYCAGFTTIVGRGLNAVDFRIQTEVPCATGKVGGSKVDRRKVVVLNIDPFACPEGCIES
jgi:hypothetical protein